MSKYAPTDTIAAIITPPGEGGIAALRLAGSRRPLSLLSKFFTDRGGSESVKFKPFQMRVGVLRDADGDPIDEITAVYMPAGKSYTGLDQVEIFCHGGRQVAKQILELFLNAGARAAEPGEFTRLAFLNGNMDLTRAEAVADIISANTDQSLAVAREHLMGAYSDTVEAVRERLIDLLAEIEASVDYPEEDISPREHDRLLAMAGHVLEPLQELIDSYRGGRIIRDGFKVAIAGRPNAGKSSLFNLLLKQERALVTPTAGTTRDYLSEWIDLDGYAVNIIDTAGLREKGSQLEKAGQARADEIIKKADLVLWLVDVAQRGYLRRLRADLDSLERRPIILLYNKIDLVENGPKYDPNDSLSLSISCRTGKGISALKRLVVDEIDRRVPDRTSGVVVTSARHAQKLRAARKEIRAATKKIRQRLSPELTALDLRQALSELDEITGRVYNDDILGRIFSRFCVGK